MEHFDIYEVICCVSIMDKHCEKVSIDTPEVRCEKQGQYYGENKEINGLLDETRTQYPSLSLCGHLESSKMRCLEVKPCSRYRGAVFVFTSFIIV